MKGMEMTAPSTTTKRSRRRWTVSAVAVLALLAALFGLNAWMASMGEDGAPVWNCHTMGDRQCGPESPWHGFYVGSID